ncbi:MAG: acetyl-CoA C-acyltransferase [Candidatus Thermoplasmatota archaeon]|nr:acetyl-CoA C-acyltransferase [Candidatus Thermoplasmatota archaeon]
MHKVYVVSARRTPIGKFGKSLSSLTAPELGAKVISQIVKETGVTVESIQEVIMGNVIQAGVGQNPAGQASSLAGLPDYVVKYTVNTVCASGMLSVENAAREIMLGERDLIIAGGMESMSNSPLLLPSSARWGVRQLLGKDLKIGDSMLNDGLIDAFYHEHMGFSAEISGRKFGLTRREVDEFAMRSQTLASNAWKSGEYRNEVVQMKELQTDEGIRTTDMDTLSSLKPAFTDNGILTAGNSSQLSDGASALLLASEKALKEFNLKPVAEISGFQAASLSPRDFVEAPIPATRILLDRLGKNMDYFDLVEHNEAFSVASLVVQRELGIDDAKFNVNGGAIAMGHPIGNSGSRILVTLINALRSRKMDHGLATICHGGGGGHTMTLEMIR